MSSLRDQYIASMTPRKGGIKPIYRLRWVFHWISGKSKCGVWNGATNNFEDTAAAISKSGLLVAQIEGEDFQGGGVKIFYECDGYDYITSRWIAASSIAAPIGKWNVNNITLEPDIIGLSFLTRKERFYVYVDGSTDTRLHRQNEKIDNIREHKL